MPGRQIILRLFTRRKNEINTNVGALFAKTNGSIATMKMEKSMLRLSSGLRINGAADDVAGNAVAVKMKSQILEQICQSEIQLMLHRNGTNSRIWNEQCFNIVLRMREISVQMNNGIYSAADRANASSELMLLEMRSQRLLPIQRLMEYHYCQVCRHNN